MILLIGLAVTNRAVAAALSRRGCAAVAADDHPDGDTRAAAERIGIRLVERPDDAELGRLVEESTTVVPSPGVPDHHPVFALARRCGVAVQSEFDLARQWDRRPLLAVTGTDGKTTVTTLVTTMLERSGVSAVAVGNTELPLVAAIDDPSVDAFVVEASSFRLAHTERFEPAVATWLNLAADHQDAHSSLAAYEAAKALATSWGKARHSSSVRATSSLPGVISRSARTR
ncbi:hypothetical protein BH18ACT4_BH18ACT4_15290 [soil metagenome]